MRLSSRLSDKNKNNGEIESFIDWERYTISPDEETDDVQLISAGDFIEIQIGTITLPFYSTVCRDSVSFVSPKKLHCLIINNSMQNPGIQRFGSIQPFGNGCQKIFTTLHFPIRKKAKS